MVYFLSASKHEKKNGGTFNTVRLLQVDGFGVWGHVDYFPSDEVFEKIRGLSLFAGVPVIPQYSISVTRSGTRVNLLSLRVDDNAVPLDLQIGE